MEDLNENFYPVQNATKPHLANLENTAILQFKINITEIPQEKLSNTAIPQTPMPPLIRVITALGNVTDSIDGLVLIINHPQTDEIMRLLGKACNKLPRGAQSRLIEEETVDFAPQVHSQRRGSTAFEIKEEQLSFLLNEGFKIPTSALLFGVSTRTVERGMKKCGLSVSG